MVMHGWSLRHGPHGHGWYMMTLTRRNNLCYGQEDYINEMITQLTESEIIGVTQCQ